LVRKIADFFYKNLIKSIRRKTWVSDQLQRRQVKFRKQFMIWRGFAVTPELEKFAPSGLGKGRMHPYKNLNNPGTDKPHIPLKKMPQN